MVLSQQQLNARRNFIGSSEASIIANGSYSSWYELIEQKRNSLEKIFDKQTRFLMEAGTFMEPFVLEKGEEIMKMKFRNQQSGKTVDHGIAPIHSTYDAIAADGRPVEAKTHWQFRNMDELCDLYAPQCQHHIHTSAKDGCYLVVFFGVRCNLEYRYNQRDQAWIDSYQKYSNHNIDLLTLPGNKWKWRMHGGAITFNMGYTRPLVCFSY